MNVIPFPEYIPILEEYLKELSNKDESTIDSYMRILRQFTDWMSERPGSRGNFQPGMLTRTALETYLAEMEVNGYSISHRNRVKSVVGNFGNWLMEEKGLIRKNPAQGIVIPPQPQMAPRMLSPDQRYVLKNLIERDGEQRSAAIFALGYWAGCRPSDVSWLLMDNVYVGPKIGRIKVGHKGRKIRELDLRNEVRRELFEYIYGPEKRKFPESRYVFTSQRSDRLTESGIHQWLEKIKNRATKDEWELIQDVTFHDLRHDFAHRAREAGWDLEEIAFYLGHVTNKGTPAIQTTVRYTQPSMEQINRKLKEVRG
ncbi:tyrosine-type recombinase/integrase [Paenibacillus larvae]|uniref:Integrase family protein n=1 Tax=Paenibacillus larvae subsp. larvae TaxID=147375 RepID=A0A2L1U7H6_9BACL|nr:tyrosine-type recombinase/integrase [Paenibacillus larvae]AVF28887.1 integrase family protein [Paenibacillus larvae subsp. larvae]MCY9502914.1 tyrosine-type recombinase/integrase [Paenibacillus larvae]MDR5608781.1 tyrosine-type recombinase/integrase [Paenibacillus larvae]